MVNVHQAKTRLSKLLEAVGRGEKVATARAGWPVARLVPLQRVRQLGLLRRRLTVPEEVLAAFERGA